MKRFSVLLIFCFFVGACASSRTIVIPPGPGGGREAPPLELRIGLFNESSRYLKIEGLIGTLGTDTLVLGPGRSITVATRRYGEYSGIVTAFREGWPKKGGGIKLKGFVAQKEFKLRLNGSVRSRNGRHFGDYEVFRDGNFRYNSRKPYPSWGIGQLIRLEIKN